MVAEKNLTGKVSGVVGYEIENCMNLKKWRYADE